MSERAKERKRERERKRASEKERERERRETKFDLGWREKEEGNRETEKA